MRRLHKKILYFAEDDSTYSAKNTNIKDATSNDSTPKNKHIPMPCMYVPTAAMGP
jgi:hypothetical protein